MLTIIDNTERKTRYLKEVKKDEWFIFSAGIHGGLHVCIRELLVNKGVQCVMFYEDGLTVLKTYDDIGDLSEPIYIVDVEISINNSGKIKNG